MYAWRGDEFARRERISSADPLISLHSRPAKKDETSDNNARRDCDADGVGRVREWPKGKWAGGSGLWGDVSAVVASTKEALQRSRAEGDAVSPTTTERPAKDGADAR